MTTTTTNRPSHRVSLILDQGRGKKSKFIEIGAAWPTDKGGLTLDLDVDLRRGDRLYFGEIDWATIDARKEAGEAAQ